MLIDIHFFLLSIYILYVMITSEKVPPSLPRQEAKLLDEKVCQEKMEMSSRGYRMQLRTSWVAYQVWEDSREDSQINWEAEYSSSKMSSNSHSHIEVHQNSYASLLLKSSHFDSNRKDTSSIPTTYFYLSFNAINRDTHSCNKKKQTLFKQ